MLQLVDTLPASSRFQHARLNDPEFAQATARAVFESDPAEASAGGLPAEWRTPEATLLRQLYDAFVASKSESPPAPYPAPSTLVDGYVKDLEARVVEEIFADVVFSDE